MVSLLYLLRDLNDGLDSKGLTEEQRDDLFDEIKKQKEWVGYMIHVGSPQVFYSLLVVLLIRIGHLCGHAPKVRSWIIAWLFIRRAKYNLNAMAHDTTIDLIRRVLDKGVNLKEVFILLNLKDS